MRVGPGLLAAVVAALAAVPSALPGPQPKPEIKIVVVSITVASTHTDKRPKGISRGDKVAYYDRLVNVNPQFGKQVGDRVGTDKGTFTYTSDTAARYAGWCALPGGTLILRGQVLAASGGQELIPVVGGTGNFRGANGYLLVGPGRHAVLNTYEFTVAGSQTA